MRLIRILTQNKSSIFLTFLLIYILFWFIIESYKQLIKSNKISVDYQTSNFYFILSKLNINLLLIDPFLLDHLFIRQFSFQQFSKRLITFGISNNSIPLIYPLFSIKNLSIKTSIDHIFIEYNQKIIHLAILHNEKTYFLIRKNTIQLPINVELSYGDKPRAIEQ